MPDSGRDLLDAVRELLEHLVDSLPPGAAELREEPSADECCPVDLVAAPRASGAASITAHAMNGECVSLWMSDGSVFEVFMGRGRDARAECLRTVELVCEAVIGGTYEATVWRKHGVTTRSRAVARARGTTRISSWATFSNPFVRSQKIRSRPARWRSAV